MVKDYSLTVQEIPNGETIRSGPFMVGGHEWCIHYCPNGYEQSSIDYISFFICLYDVDTKEVEKVHTEFSFVDQVECQKSMCIRADEPCTFTKFYGWGSDKFMKRDALERSTHLKDDCFTIRCDVMVCKDPNTWDIGCTMSDIGQHLDYLLQNKVGADVTFEVSGETFSAHRCVLAARSTVFRAQLFGPMKEGTTASVIQIKDMEAKVFKTLLNFIYTGSCLDMEEDTSQVVEEGKEEEAVEYVMWLHNLFVAADRYDLQRLKLLCEEHLSEHIGVTSVASTLALAEQHHSHRLREACLKFIQVQSPSCLEKVMATDGWEHITTTYPSVLNNLIAKLASNQKGKKKKDKKKKDKKRKR
jgi:speckle-type POZ protein